MHQLRVLAAALPTGLVLWWCAVPESAADRESAHTRQRVQQLRARLGPAFRVAVEPPFVVASDQSEEDFQRTLRHTIRWSVQCLKRDFFARTPRRAPTIFLFDGPASYHQHVLALLGKEPDTPFGYYDAAHQALVMDISTGGGTLVHEIVHPFMAANFPLAPPWFNEGMASLFEACREQDGHIVGVLNWRLSGLQKGIDRGNLVPLGKLLKGDAAAFYDDPHGMHYAEARYLLYYIQQKGKLRAFYREFADRAEVDPSGERTLCRVLGVDSIKQLQVDWLQFLAGLSH